MTVELIYDRDCPNVLPARANLVKAFAASDREARWIEWDRSAPDSPAHVRGYGSPTVLVGGKDIAGGTAGAASASCRLYRTAAGRFDGIPSVEQILAALSAHDGAPGDAAGGSPGWRSSLAAAPGIVSAFLPNLVCPACLPAYAGLLSAIGLGFVLDRSYLLLLTGALLMLAVGALAFRAWRLRRYGPLVVGLAAAIAVLAGKFALDSSLALYGGIAGLVAASVWNAWPVRASGAGVRRAFPSLRQQSLFRKEMSTMVAKRKIEVFSAGCPACAETIELVNRMACASCEVSVLDMTQVGVAKRAKELGIRSVPAVVIDGKLADCCAGRGPDENVLRGGGLGVAM